MLISTPSQHLEDNLPSISNPVAHYTQYTPKISKMSGANKSTNQDPSKYYFSPMKKNDSFDNQKSSNSARIKHESNMHNPHHSYHYNYYDSQYAAPPSSSYQYHDRYRHQRHFESSSAARADDVRSSQPMVGRGGHYAYDSHLSSKTAHRGRSYELSSAAEQPSSNKTSNAVSKPQKWTNSEVRLLVLSLLISETEFYFL